MLHTRGPQKGNLISLFLLTLIFYVIAFTSGLKNALLFHLTGAKIKKKVLIINIQANNLTSLILKFKFFFKNI